MIPIGLSVWNRSRWMKVAAVTSGAKTSATAIDTRVCAQSSRREASRASIALAQ
jgi:hypothetical protein